MISTRGKKAFGRRTFVLLLCTAFFVCFGFVSVESGEPQHYDYKIVNLISPWNFPQFSWPHNGVPWLEPPRVPADYPGWEFEKEAIKGLIDFYMDDWGYNTFRLLCQRPLHYIYYQEWDELEDCWGKIVEVVEYIKNKGGKLILCGELGWDYSEEQYWEWSYHNDIYYQSIPSRLCDPNAPDSLMDAVVFWEVSNEPDHYLWQGADPDINEDELLNWLYIQHPYRVYFLTDMIAMANWMLGDQVGRGVPWYKLSAGCNKAEGAYVINANMDPFPLGCGSRYDRLNFHAPGGWTEVLSRLYWITNKDFGYGNPSASYPIVLGESCVNMHWWTGLPLTSPDGWNRKEMTPEEYQDENMRDTWEGVYYAKNQGIPVIGLGFWASVDLLFPPYDPNPLLPPHLRFWISGMAEIYMQSWKGMPSPAGWNFTIYPRAALKRTTEFMADD